MWGIFAGIAQLVEHNLAKVGVASSSLVSRSIFFLCMAGDIIGRLYFYDLAGWQSGYAAACKAVDAGSIPTPASSSKVGLAQSEYFWPDQKDQAL
jgi:hypothetical protein